MKRLSTHQAARVCLVVLPLVAGVVAAAPRREAGRTTSPRHPILEAYPPALEARLGIWRPFLERLPKRVEGDTRFVIQRVSRWVPGQTLRVAFQGGDAAAHREIAEAASEWMQHGNIKLDFGLDPAQGTYRSWSREDREYAAEIRISFDQPGYWSTVGNDSANGDICPPREASLNLEGFDADRPGDWRTVVLHEFGHALGFHHEHQHPAAECDSEMRWEDDSGYVPTQDASGRFGPDSAGRMPGIYTMLGGPPNQWPRGQIDHNLRKLKDTEAYFTGPFDPNSIMKYHFPEWMYKKGQQSRCYSERNLEISAQDKRGTQQVYPTNPAAVKSILNNLRAFLTAALKKEDLPPGTRKLFEAELRLVNTQLSQAQSPRGTGSLPHTPKREPNV